MVRKSSLLYLLRGLIGVAVAAWAGAAPGQDLVKLRVERDGVYRVTEKQLARAGFAVAPEDVDRLRLRLRDQRVPVRVLRDGLGPEDGSFALDFVGRFPRGKKTHEDEYNRASTYRLDVTRDDKVARYRDIPEPGLEGPVTNRSELRMHYEVNRKLMRFSGGQTPDEVWYWDLLMASDKQPRTFKIRAERVAAGKPFKLRVHFMGYSSVPADPDHVVEVHWNGRPLPEASWDAQTPRVYEQLMPAGSLLEGNNVLSLRVTGAKTGGLDVVLLDWVQIDYTQQLRVGAQLPFNGPGTQRLSLDAGPQGARLTVFDERHESVQTSRSARRFTRFQPPPDSPAAPVENSSFWAVRDGGFLTPAISVGKFEDLRAARRADFVIISDGELMPAATRLAEARRAEGLSVLTVDVQDIYDNFSGSFLEPEAIRAFLKHAWDTWQPRPFYVLLFGDASWDYTSRNVSDADYPDHVFIPESWSSVVPKNESDPLRPGDSRNDRQRVPTYQWQSPWGHAASDNYFACLEGDDSLPDVALGRLTVGTPAEADAAVDKLLAYGRLPPATSAPRALFITDQYDYHKSQSDHLGQLVGKRGFEVTKVYPQAAEKDNLGNSAAIRAAWDGGPAVVVFAGHGGRYIWRTGPPDPLKNHDLFTLDDLDRLQATDRLPIVLSLTCYSAPFDHPTADSIGEKLMRLQDKGAIAILASSWRNVPPFSLAESMLETLGDSSHVRLGDTFLAAMRRVGQSDSLNTYNLLGDPSLPVQRLPDMPKAVPPAAAPAASP